jgi:hypothetical protein
MLAEIFEKYDCKDELKSNYNQLLDSKVKMLAQGLLKQADVAPTNLQQAVAIAALSLLQSKHKQLWHFYAGMGKSFIVAMIALLSCVA